MRIHAGDIPASRNSAKPSNSLRSQFTQWCIRCDTGFTRLASPHYADRPRVEKPDNGDVACVALIAGISCPRNAATGRSTRPSFYACSRYSVMLSNPGQLSEFSAEAPNIEMPRVVRTKELTSRPGGCVLRPMRFDEENRRSETREAVFSSSSQHMFNQDKACTDRRALRVALC